MRFIWDLKKSAKTLRDRGFSFADASLVFNARWLTIGRASFESAPSFVAVVYTERKVNAKKTIRIISARAANRKEVQKIEHQTESARCRPTSGQSTLSARSG